MSSIISRTPKVAPQAVASVDLGTGDLLTFVGAITRHSRSRWSQSLSKVIEHGNNAEWDALLELPDGILYKRQPVAPVSACVEDWHLDSFIQSEEV